MKDGNTNQSIHDFARRLQCDPRFMAYALYAYCQQERLEEKDLAGQLGIAPEMLARLALCRRPLGDSPLFAEQVCAIADYTLIDETELAKLLRQVESLERLAQRPASPVAAEAESQMIERPPGLLAAARDRGEPEEQRAPPNDQNSPDE